MFCKSLRYFSCKGEPSVYSWPTNIYFSAHFFIERSKERPTAAGLRRHGLLLLLGELADLVGRLGQDGLGDDADNFRHCVEIIENFGTNSIFYSFCGSSDTEPEYFRILSGVPGKSW